MPDLAMCSRRGCPRRASCYRYLAEPHPYWQTFFSAPTPVGDECGYYLEADSSLRALDVEEVDAHWDSINRKSEESRPHAQE